MYDVISIMTEVLYALALGFCLQYFFGEFLESRLRERKWNGLLVTVLYGVLKLILNLIMPSGYESVVVIAKQALIFVCLLVIAFCFYHAAHTITVFLIITFMAVSEICFFLAYMVLQIGGRLFNLWSWCFEQGCISPKTDFEVMIKITAYGLQVLMCVVFILLLYSSLKKIVNSYKEKDYTIHRTELLFILAPGMAGLLLCILLRIIIIMVENGVPRLLYDKYPVLILIVPAILLLSLISIMYGVKLFQDMIYLNREKNSRIILEKQIGSMQEHMAEMERIYSGVRSMKHDMRNTLAVIMQLSGKNREKENMELQAYLSELNQTFDRLEVKFKTGNTVVDTLLNMKYHEGVRTTPDLRMDAEYLLFTDNLLIQSYDIGIILGNALDNAIEACRKLKEKEMDAEAFIRLSSFQKGKMIFIEIANSFDGNVIRKRQAEFPVTDKADKEAHGIGLANIKSAAEKYHGAVEWSANHKVFTLSVMMQNERSVENEFWINR